LSSESGSNGDESYDGICSTCSSSNSKATAIVTAFEPYEGKPPASGQDQNENPTGNEDPNGLSLVALEERYDLVSHANNSCQCNLCNDSKLAGAGRVSLSHKSS